MEPLPPPKKDDISKMFSSLVIETICNKNKFVTNPERTLNNIKKLAT
jgi:hypothetical protein